MGPTTRPDCVLCEAAESPSVTTPSSVFRVVEWDPALVVLINPRTKRTFIAPTNHVSDLASCDDTSLASFLAAARRLAIRFAGERRSVTTLLSPSPNEIPSCEGHAYFEAVTSPVNEEAMMRRLEGLVNRRV